MNFPLHGRVACNVCHAGQSSGFDETVTESGDWRITHNPLSWGNPEAEVAVLGFSKGPTQRGALAMSPHEAIAFKGGRTPLAKILHHIDLIDKPDARLVDRAISDRNGRFHFGSLIRCTVERRACPGGDWTGTGGEMLDKFTKTNFGQHVLLNCLKQHTVQLSLKTRLIIMLGLGSNGNYVKECRKAFTASRNEASWYDLNEIAYTDGKVTVVHTEHFKSQGALLPNWLSENRHPRGRLGLLARDAVSQALN